MAKALLRCGNASIIEHVFESRTLPSLGDLTDAALIDALAQRTRAEAISAAERLAAIGEIVARHCDDEDDASAHRAIDGWECATAAVSAACNLGRRAASAQMRIAEALRDRLPNVAAVFGQGHISAKVVATITWRTQLVVDTEALALIDTALAGAATSYGTLSATKVEQAIDVWVEKFDPAAVRRTRTAARSRDVNFGDTDDPAGTVSIWGRLSRIDGAILKQRLTDMACGVCDGDPRTMAQRRSDALGALGAGADRLTCLCGSPDCAAAGVDPRADSVVIYVLTDELPTSSPSSDDSTSQADVSPTENAGDDGDAREPHGVEDPQPENIASAPAAPRDPLLHGEPDVAELAADSVPAVSGGPGVLLGGGIVPAPVLAELIATGAAVKPLKDAGALGDEAHYRPSSGLAAFVRMRDLTCQFPGCGVSAQYCDLDHAVAWPAGPTHPGNLGAKCRNHHLLKTFHTGVDGWTDVQHPDGSHTWTAPTGHTSHTAPFSRILFPHWKPHTPPPPAGPPPAPNADRVAKMPTRARTRRQTRDQRINAERRLNIELDRPPPF